MWQFLNPLFLWAGAAAAIPLVLHMMQRRRVVPMPFSTIRFLKLAQKRSSNRIRMENFLLWLLRTLLLLILVLAFAMPILRTHAFGRFMGSAQRDIAIVWDVSYSMGYESSRRNVWQDSRQTVLDLIDGLGPGDRLTLFVADDDVTALIEQPSGDFEQARALVNAQPIEPTDAQLAPALMAAVESLAESGRREREVFIVTDGQALAWQDFQLAAADRDVSPADVIVGDTDDASLPDAEPVRRSAGRWDPERLDGQTQLFAALLGAETPENTAPLSVAVQPATLMAEVPAQLAVRIGRTGPAQNLSVTLHLNGEEISRRSLIIAEDSIETVNFALPPLPAGVHEAWIETPPDGLNIDNRLYFLLRVRDQLPVAVVGTAGDTFFLSRALNPVTDRALIETVIFRPTELPLDGLSRFSSIFLCNALPLSGQAIIALENYVRMGGLLAVFPGDRARAGDYESWNLLPAWPEQIEEIPAGRRRRVLMLLEPTDPLFTGMQLPPGTIPTIAVQRELRLARRHGHAVTVVGSSSEFPFLIARDSGTGRVLLFTVSADRRWSDLPLSPFFLPFVHQAVRFGAGLGADPLFLDPHRTLLLSDIIAVIPEGASLRDPEGASLPIRTVQQEHRAIQIVEDVMIPGVYALRKPGEAGTEAVFAVNAPRKESDLTRIDIDKIPELLNVKALHLARDREQLLRLVNEHRLGRPLGEILLWIAFLLSMAELVMANRLSRKTKSLTEQMVIESSGRVRAG